MDREEAMKRKPTKAYHQVRNKYLSNDEILVDTSTAIYKLLYPNSSVTTTRLVMDERGLVLRTSWKLRHGR